MYTIVFLKLFLLCFLPSVWGDATEKNDINTNSIIFIRGLIENNNGVFLSYYGIDYQRLDLRFLPKLIIAIFPSSR